MPTLSMKPIREEEEKSGKWFLWTKIFRQSICCRYLSTDIKTELNVVILQVEEEEEEEGIPDGDLFKVNLEKKLLSWIKHE